MAKKTTPAESNPHREQPYDRATRLLSSWDPAGVLSAMLGRPVVPIRIEDPKTLSTRNPALFCDWLYWVEIDGELVLVQVEFQTQNQAHYGIRMLDYRLRLRKKHGVWTLQITSFIGPKTCKITPELTDNLNRPEFGLSSLHRVIDLKEYEARLFREQNTPPCIIFSFFCKFEGESAFVEEGLLEIKRQVSDVAFLDQLTDCLYDLLPLRSENFALMTQQLVERIFYPKDMDYWMRVPKIREVHEKGLDKGLEKGREEGLEKGLEKGREEGELNTKKEGIREGIALGLPLESLAKIFHLSVEDVKALANGTLTNGNGKH